MTTDLTVIGAGIFGLSIAWEAARRGARVRVIEAVGIGAGASGGLVGALSPHVPGDWNAKKAFQLDALLMADGFWDGVRAASGLDPGYARLGRLQPLADGAALVLARARAEEAARLWRGKAAWDVIRAGSLPDWEPPSPSGWLVRDSLSARIAPRAALAALAAAVQARGGWIEVGEAEPTPPVIWATGVEGLAALGAGGGVKGQAALLAFDARDRPQIFAGGLHIVPHADGTVAIGSTSEQTWANPASTDGALDALIARARTLCPALAAAPVVARWAALRPRALSRAPLLGPWPGRPGHYVANGGFKIGFGIAPGVARAMCDLVLDGQDTIPADFALPRLREPPAGIF
jgi:glycine/D-amino acid oxidase-like deaminating enzyme